MRFVHRVGGDCLVLCAEAPPVFFSLCISAGQFKVWGTPWKFYDPPLGVAYSVVIV
jgi:hypothetical protein